MRKLNDTDLGKFVTVYFVDEGKRDGILLEFLGDTDARVWFPSSTEEGESEVSEVDCNNQIVAVGLDFPLF